MKKETGRSKKMSRRGYWGYIFLIPFFAAFGIFQFIPLVTTVYNSFFEYFRSGLKQIGPNYVGLDNFITLFKSGDLLMYLKNTMIMWVLGFVPQILVSLLLGAWFTDPSLRLKGKRFFKTVIYLPNLIMASAFSMLFFTLFADSGPVNAALMHVGIIRSAFSFMSNVWSVRGLVAMMNFLMWFGNTTILLMAGMMGIDQSLFEAARIDGAGEIRIFNTIVFPLMKPAVAVQAIFTFVESWNNYFTPNLIIRNKMRKTLPILLAELRNSDWKTFDMGQVYAMIAFAIFPVIIVYILLSGHIVGGVTAGGVKE